MTRTGRTESNPAYLIYAESELADASQMTFEQFGMFARLRAIAWREHGLSTDRAEIARRLMIAPARFAKHAAIVLESFREHEGRLVIPALERARVEQEERRAKASEHGKKGAKGRWDAVPNAGAMPEHTGAMPEHSPGIALALPSDGYVVVDAVVGVVASPPPPPLGLAFHENLEAVDRAAYEKLLSQVPDRSSWQNEISAMLEKDNVPPATMAIAIRDFVAAGKAPKGSVLQFRRYVQLARESADLTIPAEEVEEIYDLTFREGFATVSRTTEQRFEHVDRLVERGTIKDGDFFKRYLSEVKPQERFRNADKWNRKDHLKWLRTKLSALRAMPAKSAAA
jgi:hypothetical protein